MWAKLFKGVLASLIALYGAKCLVTQQGFIPGRPLLGNRLDLRGLDAMVLGVAYLAVAAFIGAGGILRGRPRVQIPMVGVACIVLIASLAFIVFRYFIGILR
jgi:hypothetical protein